MVTAIIKTFERPAELRKLVESIRFFFPEMKIIIADDSKFPQPIEGTTYLTARYDIGLSAGRNLALSKVKTKYFALFDDDHICTEHTKLYEMADILENKGFDLIGGDFIEHDGELNEYHGTLKFDREYLLLYVGQSKGEYNFRPLYDVTHNFFVANTKKVKKIKWDENIKYGREHADFFLRAKDLKITHDSKYSVFHQDTVKLWGNKSSGYIRVFNYKWGIKESIVIDRGDSNGIKYKAG